MRTFGEKFTALAIEAERFLENLDDSIIVLATEEELEVNEDLIYELPNIGYVTKHGFYEEYAVVSVEKKQGEIKLKTLAKGEGNNETFTLDDVQSDEVLYIADAVREKLK